MNILGFIPARSVSMGIKNKNMALLNKKPLIYYTLDIAKKIKRDVFPFVSTDSKKIRKYCEKMGFETNYIRPKILARDRSPIFGAIKHGLYWLRKKEKKIFDAVLLIQPTSPLREIAELKLAIKKFKKQNLKSLISVTRMKEHPYECIRFNNGKWNYIVKNPRKNSFGRQVYKKNFYFIDGSFYLAKVDFLLKNKGFVNTKNTKIFVLKKNWPIDIDTKDDLLVAKAFMKKIRK